MQNKKRILSVTIKQMVDDSPDTSWLGAYSNRAEENAIDRAHALDCIENDAPQQQKLLRIADAIENDRPVCEEHIDATDTDCEVCTEEYAYTKAMDAVRELSECDCGRGNWNRREYRYFNPSDNYKDETPEDIRKYVRQDYDRMESLNAGHWCFIGICAYAEVSIPSGTSSVESEVSSGGLWGIESDSDNSYLESVEKEELSDLRTQLKALGFSSRAISTAFKNVERQDA